MPQPTKEQIAAQKHQDYLMRLVEAPYIRRLISAINKYIRSASKAYLEQGNLPEALWLEHRKDIFEISKKYNGKIINIFAKEFYSNEKFYTLLLETKDFDKWLTTIYGYWVSDHVAIVAGVIANTTRDDIRKAIEKSLSNNYTNVNTAKNILKLRGLSPHRAMVIARTETHNAAMYAGMESAKRLSRETSTQLLKVWIPTQDSRTRDFHSGMAGHDAIVMDALFNVGDDRMSRPGDPRGGAKNVINCRCTLSYETL